MGQYFLTTCYQSDKSSLANFKTCLSFFGCYRFLYHWFVISFSPFKCVNALTKLLRRRDLYLETDEYLFVTGNP